MTDIAIPVRVAPRTPIADAFRKASDAYDKHVRALAAPVSEHCTFEIELWRDGLRVVARGTYLQHPECGTDTGYHYHLRKYGTATCDACKKAHARSEANRAKRRARGDAA